MTDSGQEFSGATTGDTVFAIPGASNSAAVAGLELLPAGTIPYAFGIDFSTTGLLVSDAAGSGAGQRLAIDLGGVTPSTSVFASGFDYTGGVLVDGSRVLVSESVQPTFESAISSFDAAGTFQSVVSGPTYDHGSNDLAKTPGGEIVASGAPTLVAIDGGGVVTPLVTGLDGGTGFDAFGGGVAVNPFTGRIDFLASSFSGADDDKSVHRLVPVERLVPGGGNSATDCVMEVYGVELVAKSPGMAARVGHLHGRRGLRRGRRGRRDLHVPDRRLHQRGRRAPGRLHGRGAGVGGTAERETRKRGVAGHGRGAVVRAAFVRGDLRVQRRRPLAGARVLERRDARGQGQDQAARPQHRRFAEEGHRRGAPGLRARAAVNRGARLLRFAGTAAALLGAAAAAGAGDPWLDRVRAFEPGASSGFGADGLPGIVLGPPEGLGDRQGSVDVVSLGTAGRIVVSFDDNAVVDGDGDDLVIFENPFFGGSLLFTELAFVEVSADGREWKQFPWSADTLEGLAGQVPVLANSTNGLDPLDPLSGGDRFDLADVGLDYVRFVRLTDAGTMVPDPGNASFPGTKGGFDLDAAAAVSSVDLGCVTGTVFADGQPAARRARGAEVGWPEAAPALDERGRELPLLPREAGL